MNGPGSTDRCTADGGCDYLRSLALFEGLAGFDLTARAFNGIAAQCETEGCWRRSAAREGAADETTAAARFPTIKAAPRPRAAASSAHAGDAAALIPFSRAAHLDIANDRSGNWMEHRRLDVASLEPTDSLGYLYGYWRSLRATTPCALSNVDVLHLVRARIVGKLHIVNVASSDPEQFAYELFGYSVPVEAVARPAAISVPIWREKILRDYNTARLTAMSSLGRIRAQLNGRTYHYTRLILPFFDRRRRTSHLAIAIRREPGDGRLVGAG